MAPPPRPDGPPSDRTNRWLYGPVSDFVPLGKIQYFGPLSGNPGRGFGFRLEPMKTCHAALIEHVHRHPAVIIGTDSIPLHARNMADASATIKGSTPDFVNTNHPQPTLSLDCKTFAAGAAGQSTAEVMFVSNYSAVVGPRYVTPTRPCGRWLATAAAAAGSDRMVSCGAHSHGNNPQQIGGN
jgi:hypothetical protein